MSVKDGVFPLIYRSINVLRMCHSESCLICTTTVTSKIYPGFHTERVLRKRLKVHNLLHGFRDLKDFFETNETWRVWIIGRDIGKTHPLYSEGFTLYISCIFFRMIQEIERESRNFYVPCYLTGSKSHPQDRTKSGTLNS